MSAETRKAPARMGGGFRTLMAKEKTVFSENIILTPICAHSLTQCPLVLSSDLVLCLELLEPSAASLLIDGQRRTKFEFGSRLFVRKATQSALLLYTKHYDYFKILREKFRWG